MNRISLIEGLDERKTRETLNIILRDRKNEFREIAEAIGIPQTSNDWEVIILRFCLDFEDCFKTWINDKPPDTLEERKCMTIMREIGKVGNHIDKVIHLQDIACTIYTEFHQAYKKTSQLK